eukprot:TRINITY_DN413_c0_g1_i3.p1 TRINITY_DN413_c0_g1~~TRINITY_DN413_c0_g1_i3.p1  ORF type:complete len:125 (-),score=42.39 TRINITY_DN413_c0_g1_i3:1280-1654(-)
MLSELPSRVVPSKVVPSKVVPSKPAASKVAREPVKQEEVEAKRAELQAEAEKQKLREQYKLELLVATEEEQQARIDVKAALQEKVAIEKKATEYRLKAEAANLAARQAKVLEQALTASAKEGRL